MNKPRLYQVGPGVKTTFRSDIFYQIPKGKHASKRYTRTRRGTWKPSWFSWLPFMLTRGRFQKFTAVLRFAKEWHIRPNNNVDWLDINKLVGINFGLGSPHQNSIRIGWIFNYDQPGYVNLYLYTYNDGTRSFTPVETPLCSIRMDQPVEIQISLMKYSRVYLNIYQEENQLYGKTLPDGNPDNELVDTDDNFFEDPKSKWFSVLEPYHGGQLEAIKNHDIFLDKIEIEYT